MGAAKNPANPQEEDTATTTVKNIIVTGIPTIGATEDIPIPYVRGLPVRREIGYYYPPPKGTTPEDEKKRKQWTLFVLGLREFQELPVDNRGSYYQIASIHGLPDQKWDGSDFADTKDPTKEVGFCHHNDALFPPWHRPYIALFEQRIWEEMGNLIEHWKLSKDDEEAWTTARNEWRFPYWDFAARQSDGKFGIPTACCVAKVEIYPPPGATSLKDKTYEDTIANPLEKFVNPEKDKNGNPLKFGYIEDLPGEKGKKSMWSIKRKTASGVPWGECTATSRHGIRQLADEEPAAPTEGKVRVVTDVETKVENGKESKVSTTTRWVGLDGINNWEVANATMNIFFGEEWAADNFAEDAKKARRQPPPGGLADAINRLFTSSYSNWRSFATTQYYRDEKTTNPTGYLSIEFIHNAVHYIGGGGGGLDEKARRAALEQLKGKEAMTTDQIDEAMKATDYHRYVGHLGDVPVAAFDPLFWLLHCNIDRLWAMWQVRNWDAQTNNPDMRPTKEELQFDLRPFRRTNSGYLIAPDVRDWTNLNYQYDTLDCIPAIKNEKGEVTKFERPLLPNGRLNENLYQEQLLKYVQYAYPGTPYWFNSLKSGKQEFTDYAVTVDYDRYGISTGGGYTIEVEFKKDITDKNTPGYPVGVITNFAGMDPADCANCNNQATAETMSRGQVSLTTHLFYLAGSAKDQTLKEGWAFGDLTDAQDKDQVTAFLMNHLDWSFVATDGTALNVEDDSNPRLKNNTIISVLSEEGVIKDNMPQFLPNSRETLYEKKGIKVNKDWPPNRKVGA